MAFILLLLLSFPSKLTLRQHPMADSTYTDSIRGQLITTVTTRGTFDGFDKHHADRFFLRDASDQMLLNLIMTAPETDLFVADHAKDDLKITYQTRELPTSGGETERVYYLTQLRSLRTGDDVKDWPEKLQNNSDLLSRDSEELRELREH